MIVKLMELLNDAKKNNYAVPAFAVENQLMCKAAIEASEKENAPIILLAGYNSNNEDILFLDYVYECAKQSKTKIAIMKDHTKDFSDSIKGIYQRFPAIMIDRSTLDLKENIKQVKEFVEIAHASDIEVEAELGHVGIGIEIDKNSKDNFTKPEEAVLFVKETNVDCLAVSIGNAHGLYKGEPEIDFELLNEIASKVEIPLVLHGATGTGEDCIRKMCKNGIQKINIGTELYMSSVNAVMNNIENLSKSPYLVYEKIVEEYKNVALKWIDLCGTKNRS